MRFLSLSLSNSRHKIQIFSSRAFSITYTTLSEDIVFDSELIQIPEFNMVEPHLVHGNSHFYIINFNYSKAHLYHRNSLYRFLYDVRFLSNFDSHGTFLLGIYWYLEYLLTDIEETLELFSFPFVEKGLLRLVIRFLQNEVLILLHHIGYISIDVPRLLKDIVNLDYNTLTESVNNDIYCYMEAIRQCVSIERLSNSTGVAHFIRIDYGDYLLLFPFNVQIIENICSIEGIEILGNYYLEDAKSWLNFIIRGSFRPKST